MKLPFAIDDSRLTICRKSAAAPAFNRQSPIVNHRSQSGIALVITLILLAVALVMALAFLVISSQQRGSVTTQTQTTTTRLAADAALSAAEAQIAANVLSATNPYNYGLVVSTNYINPLGFNPALGANPTNVNYYDRSGNPLAGNDFLQNLANLYYLPRAPVLINSNDPVQGRFYLDLNRNGRDDPNGELPQIGPNGGYLHPGGIENNDPNGALTNFMVGDPEWIGILRDPSQPYGPDNPFVARYAFIALPVGNSLDLNAIYNQAHRGLPSLPASSVVNPSPFGVRADTFTRNEGVGSWELNLAAFLADLNTNEWGKIIDPPSALGKGNGYYDYNEALGNFNYGRAFDDARAMLAYRYRNDFNTLNLVPNLFGIKGTLAFENDGIDEFTYGLPYLMTGFGLPGENDLGLILNNAPWVGSDNTNHFFNLTADLFDSAKIQNPYAPAFGFTDRLLNAGTNTYGGATVSTYNRYTFYRMLSQIGTDSRPVTGKMNLNYDNLDSYVTNGVTYPPAATNFLAWTPLGFFTNAADRLLKAYTAQWAVGYFTNDIFPDELQVTNPCPNFVATFNVTAPFGVTDIPVWVSNRFVYTPAVNRLLQLAANMYDATTNNLGVDGNRYDYPSVFRPLFTVTRQNGYNNVFITGYTNVASFNGPDDLRFTLPIDITQLAETNAPVLNQPVNVYGVPWIVGAKKGFPNFNELAMDTAFQLTRKVEVTRASPDTPASQYHYYQMFILNLTNRVGVECWNSYTNAYTNGVMIYVYDDIKSISLTNQAGLRANLSTVLATNYAVPVWPAFIPGTQSGPSFQIPLHRALMTISNSIYRFNPGGAPYLTADLGQTYETDVNGYPQPQWGLTVSNDLRVIMVDTNATPNRVIDYVELSGPSSTRNLTGEIIGQYDTGTQGNDLWATNLNGQNIPLGLANQVGVSMGLYPPNPTSGTWDKTDQIEKENEIDGFRAFFHLTPLYPGNPGESEGIALATKTNYIQAPYTPTATVVQHVSWQANDPLVHYLAADLDWVNAIRYDRTVTSLTDTSDGDNLGVINSRYAPWGIPMSAGIDQVDRNPDNLAYKDPLVTSSDGWDFPTGKLPTVGWLGRVHRGTPWQTVFLKATNILAWVQGNANGLTTWRDWTGDYNLFDATNSAPESDWLLFDLFTTAINHNASRGTLSVNAGAADYDPDGNPADANPAAGLAAWSAVFSGMVVPNPVNPASYAIINPAGPDAAALNPPLWQMVTNINATRAAFTNTDGLVGTFEHKGDILAAPALTVQSPFLAGLNPDTQISDQMYEWLPQQMMSLVRDSAAPRYVIYSFGQTLLPAPGGTYLGAGPFFGMVTNYQVVAATATRAVVQFDTTRTNALNRATDVTTPTVTPPRAVIQRFNVLPPD